MTPASRNTLPCEHGSIKTREVLQLPLGYTATLTGIRETHKGDCGSDGILSLVLCAVGAERMLWLGQVWGSGFNTNLVVLDLSACSESLDISISLIASLTSSFSTESIMRRRACRKAMEGDSGDWFEMEKRSSKYEYLDQPGLISKAALCRHCQTETSAMPSWMAGNCPSLRLSTPASLSTCWGEKKLLK